MQSIAISYAGYNKKVGDAFIVGIQVDESWFNTFRDYWNKKSLSLRMKRGILFSKLDKNLLGHQVRKANEYNILNCYFDIINSFKEFWKYPIYVEIPDLEISEDDFIKLLNEELSQNLKSKDINFNKIIRFMPHKSVALAWALAQEYEHKQIEEIESVWGKVDDDFIKRNPDSPYINKNRRIE